MPSTKEYEVVPRTKDVEVAEDVSCIHVTAVTIASPVTAVDEQTRRRGLIMKIVLFTALFTAVICCDQIRRHRSGTRGFANQNKDFTDHEPYHHHGEGPHNEYHYHDYHDGPHHEDHHSYHHFHPEDEEGPGHHHPPPPPHPEEEGPEGPGHHHPPPRPEEEGPEGPGHHHHHHPPPEEEPHVLPFIPPAPLPNGPKAPPPPPLHSEDEFVEVEIENSSDSSDGEEFDFFDKLEQAPSAIKDFFGDLVKEIDEKFESWNESEDEDEEDSEDEGAPSEDSEDEEGIEDEDASEDNDDEDASEDSEDEDEGESMLESLKKAPAEIKDFFGDLVEDIDQEFETWTASKDEGTSEDDTAYEDSEDKEREDDW